MKQRRLIHTDGDDYEWELEDDNLEGKANVIWRHGE